MNNRFIKFGLIYTAAVFVGAASPVIQADKQVPAVNEAPAQPQLNNPSLSVAPSISSQPSAESNTATLNTSVSGRPNIDSDAAQNVDAIRKSLMFQFSDYDKIDRVHQALIARKRAIGNNLEAEKGSDVLEGILSKLQTTEEKKVEIKDVPSIYLSSMIYTGHNTGMAWINNKKFNLGDTQDGIKLITVDKDSALIAWQVKDPNTDLSPIASLLSSNDEKSLDLTKSAQGKSAKTAKKKQQTEIIALDERDRIVSIRLKPNQSFDTAGLRVNEGKTAPVDESLQVATDSEQNPPIQTEEPVPPPATAPLAENNEPAPEVSTEPMSDQLPPEIDLPQSNQPIESQVPAPLTAKDTTTPDVVPPPQLGESVDLKSIIDKEEVPPLNSVTEVEKKLPDIKMENVPATNSPTGQKLPSIFDKNNESFYNRDSKPNVPQKDDSVDGQKLLQNPQEKKLLESEHKDDGASGGSKSSEAASKESAIEVKDATAYQSQAVELLEKFRKAINEDNYNDAMAITAKETQGSQEEFEQVITMKAFFLKSSFDKNKNKVLATEEVGDKIIMYYSAENAEPGFFKMGVAIFKKEEGVLKFVKQSWSEIDKKMLENGETEIEYVRNKIIKN